MVGKENTHKGFHGKGLNTRKVFSVSGMVTAMDEAVNKVMTAMRKHKLTNNLLVVFTSDVSDVTSDKCITALMYVDFS